ncbi:Major facilitator superfamily domain, general substrate transporter [Penicillium occitanis (nom. inval.)]|nr:Major facilitator superfamily domain, general substrate transporter [Penicillium occitanis (nom. inval.)]PCH04460.1 hypothetical protein PENOC_033430 [Penicillium occitanis (nom. inval.)]
MAELETSQKPGATLVESTSHDVDEAKFEASTGDLVKSRFDEMSLGRTVWVFRRVAFVTFVVYTGYVCEGFELKAGNGIVANAGFIKQFGNKKNSTGVAALNATWVTLLYISWFAKKFGHKFAFYLAWIWLVVGCAFLNTGENTGCMGVGILQVVCQVYIMEICANKIRGGMISFQAVWSNAGSIVSAVMMQQLNKHHPNNYLLAVRIFWAPVGMMILFWVFVPESPWYFPRCGEKEKAMKSMRWLYGNVEGYDFEEEYNIIAKTIEHERDMLASEPKYIHLFQGVNLKRTLTLIMFSVMGQLGCIAIINAYSTYFFSLAGIKDPFLGTVISSCCNLVAVIIWALTTDTVGRRPLMNLFQTAVVIFLFIVGGLWWTGATTGNKSASNALTGPIAFSVQSVLGIAFSYATPPMLLKLNLRSGFVFGALSVVICILMWLYVPETKGRSAAEIDELYESKLPT